MQPLERLGFPIVELPRELRDHEAVIRFLIAELVRLKRLDAMDAERAADCVLLRESQGSTNLLSGAALPHSKFSPLDQAVGIVGYAPQRIPWSGRDATPVEAVVLLLTSAEYHSTSFRKLQATVRALGEIYPPPNLQVA
ncbi:PTS sugar transporter subunit IIA [Tuwongella immobilis]|uniref:PTS EIIA type-2 domain-containing protein n=1 Tax=Tuwongella immobilis TaxID=692036 RepID=A0A6C2YU30_9BACT|nr:PTS sugar transporter subunit IIA [Tuwongella immobilis]VIP04857.1 pts fructose iia component : Marine sediment metagenome DNA, contig: S01H1_S13540 OS=marine sediment metagenome GN=S01H1_44388 PE=4 SV=1: PTS_EIIA_2 [Tuwongella immobilis]VTS07074.1 pts fructose iia component : Marine sediment metagenome DNA, contig: S01H1_S13540 OS=marine sediment metagenome GN=S01H1_44388 PE=4 SV=1: PTS_EIIA_2 [Tuwongella immobilis]